MVKPLITPDRTSRSTRARTVAREASSSLASAAMERRAALRRIARSPWARSSTICPTDHLLQTNWQVCLHKLARFRLFGATSRGNHQGRLNRGRPTMTAQSLINLDESEWRLGAHNYKPLDVVLSRGRGVWVWDIDGNRYLDCLAA